MCFRGWHWNAVVDQLRASNSSLWPKGTLRNMYTTLSDLAGHRTGLYNYDSLLLIQPYGMSKKYITE